MYIQKLPSGSYRIRKMYKGTEYAVTVPYKPRKGEADQIIAEAIRSRPTPSTETIQECCEAYLKLKSNVLSPSTIRAYRSYMKTAPTRLLQARISGFTAQDAQIYINDLSARYKPHSVRNQWAFFAVVIRQYTGQVFRVTLPQKEKQVFFVPEDDDVRRILQRIRGSEYEVAIYLAALGLRRSEILALTLEDLTEDDTVIINKAAVQDSEQNWIIKTTKTTESTREIPIPAYVADLIRKQGYVYQGQHQAITRYLTQVEKELGIERFTLHKLRHYFASQSAAMGIPEVMTMRLGGWKSPAIMKKVYTHAQEQKTRAEARKMATHISGLNAENQ